MELSLRAKRESAAATRFFMKVMHANCDPEKVTTDKRGFNKAAMDGISLDRDVPIEVRQNKYLNTIIEQDRRTVKRFKKSMMGSTPFEPLAMCWPVLS